MVDEHSPSEVNGTSQELLHVGKVLCEFTSALGDVAGSLGAAGLNFSQRKLSGFSLSN